jgi:hypothetical protein
MHDKSADSGKTRVVEYSNSPVCRRLSASIRRTEDVNIVERPARVRAQRPLLNGQFEMLFYDSASRGDHAAAPKTGSGLRPYRCVEQLPSIDRPKRLLRAKRLPHTTTGACQHRRAARPPRARRTAALQAFARKDTARGGAYSPESSVSRGPHAGGQRHPSPDSRANQVVVSGLPAAVQACSRF